MLSSALNGPHYRGESIFGRVPGGARGYLAKQGPLRNTVAEGRGLSTKSWDTPPPPFPSAPVNGDPAGLRTAIHENQEPPQL